MIHLWPQKGVRFLSTLFFIAFFLLVYTDNIFGNIGKGSIRFNPEYKLKSYSGIVTVYIFDDNGDKVEYTFEEFNADVLLLVYRKLDLIDIIGRMADKYDLSEKDSRRKMKMTINRLELWDIVIRN